VKTRHLKMVRLAGLLMLYAGPGLLILCARQHGTGPVITAVRTSVSLRIDGVLEETVWNQARPVMLRENRSGTAVTDSSVATRVFTCHDDSTLYIAFICNDPDIWTSFQKRDDHLWEEEAVEVFIDTDDQPDDYIEIEVSPANLLFDSYIVDPQQIDVAATCAFDLPGIRTAVHVAGTLNARADRDSSWTVEMALPFRDLATARNNRIDTATKIKVNFFRLDKSRGRAATGYAWSPTGARFHKPAAFGRLVLE